VYLRGVRDPTATGIRIGELSRRVGVSTDLLRAWESRYGVLSPARSTAGQRLYGADDERRVRRMQEHLARGYSPKVAARMALLGQISAGAEETEPAGPSLAVRAAALADALDRFDEAAAQVELDGLLAGWSPDGILRDVLLPLLAGLGRRWERGEISIGQEHFASGFIGGRLRGMAVGWDRGLGPLALLACAPGERHELGLLCCGVALHRRGWRVCCLGADAPVPAIAEAAARLSPAQVVVAALRREPLLAAVDELAALAADHPLAVGGAGADAEIADWIGARLLDGDPVGAADVLTAEVAAAR
jgi:MerR family transcriptional regulator, light-induced transcriptional regulator